MGQQRISLVMTRVHRRLTPTRLKGPMISQTMPGATSRAKPASSRCEHRCHNSMQPSVQMSCCCVARIRVLACCNSLHYFAVCACSSFERFLSLLGTSQTDRCADVLLSVC